jgi:hypothetical protein
MKDSPLAKRTARPYKISFKEETGSEKKVVMSLSGVEATIAHKVYIYRPRPGEGCSLKQLAP